MFNCRERGVVGLVFILIDLIFYHCNILIKKDCKSQWQSGVR